MFKRASDLIFFVEASNINPADCYQGASLTWVYSVCNIVYLREKKTDERAEDKIVARGLWFKCVFIYFRKKS